MILNNLLKYHKSKFKFVISIEVSISKNIKNETNITYKI